MFEITYIILLSWFGSTTLQFVLRNAERLNPTTRARTTATEESTRNLYLAVRGEQVSLLVRAEVDRCLIPVSKQVVMVFSAIKDLILLWWYACSEFGLFISQSQCACRNPFNSVTTFLGNMFWNSTQIKLGG